MNITADLFEAYLKCPTKCFLRSRHEAEVENAYTDWVWTQTDSYRNNQIQELKTVAARDGRIIATPLMGDPKPAKAGYAFDVMARVKNLESHIHIVELTPPGGPGKPAQFIPIRFIYTNKINNDDKLLLGFDALVLSEVLGREVGLGKIIHGDDRSTLKVKTSALAREVRLLTRKITTLLSDNSPPD